MTVALPPLETLQARVVRPDGDSGCWLWTGVRTPQGYGVFVFGGRGKSAHRWMWLVTGRAVADDMDLDHLCRNRACVNPAHLEAVTHAENMRRGRPRRGAQSRNGAKTHCPQGHPYDEANTYRAGGRRACRECRAVAIAKYRAKALDIGA